MKKHYYILLVLLVMGLASEAQRSSNNMRHDDALTIGIKGGVNLPRLCYYQNVPLSRLSQNLTFTPMGGLFVEIPAGDYFIVAPEAMYVQRGTDITYEHFSGTNVHYSMNVSYADLRLPLEFRLPISAYFQPYLCVGAEAGLRLFGQIHIDRTAPVELDQTIDVGDANMNLIHAGAFTGLGVRSSFPVGGRDLVLKFSVTYHQGLVDTYSKREHESSVPSLNVNAYHITGYRLPQGIEACIGIAIPLYSTGDDACSTFSNDHRWLWHSKKSRYGY